MTSTTLAAGALAAALLLPLPSPADTPPETAGVGVGSQYDSAHVYVAPGDLDAFVASFVATFGGSGTSQIVLTVTPTPSQTNFRAALTPVGVLSVFEFTTPMPYPFGSERTGYLVTDMDAAVQAARTSGAAVVVTPFNDPIGRDAIIEWPGGVFMQLYWHTSPPHSAPLTTVPENRVYVSPDTADEFIQDFVAFSRGRIASDEAKAPGIEIGSPSKTYRRVRIESIFGKMTVLVTDGQLPYPYGREIMGYEVASLADTLVKARAWGAAVLVAPYASEGRQSAILRFPGGYVAEIHSPGAQ